MKIYANNQSAWIKIQHHNDEYYSSFEIEVLIDIEHGIFHGRNMDVQFMNFDEFINDLDLFLLDREIVPELNGTYGTKLWFCGSADNDSIVVGFVIGDAFIGRSETIDYLIKGKIEIEPDSLEKIIENFKKIYIA